jgi:hypothetical protein
MKAPAEPMKRIARSSRIALSKAAAVVAANLILVSIGFAARPGGGGGGGTPPFTNPAWVIVSGDSIAALTLLTSSASASKDIVKSKAYRPVRAPAWSPDGNWIAFLKSDNAGSSIRVVRPDGSGERVVYSFPLADGRIPDGSLGLQWVPGEVDRILYTSVGAELYIASAAAATPFLEYVYGPIGLGAALGPDLSTAAGYQGALAFVHRYDGSEYSGLLAVALAADGASGLEIDAGSAVSALTLPDGAEVPSWSNDGTEIAFLYHNPGFGNSLVVLPVLVEPEGAILFEDEVRTLYDAAQVGAYGPYHELYHRPAWAPDDSWVAFVAQVGGEPNGTKAFDLFRVRPDGTSLTRMSISSLRPLYVDWNTHWTNDIP